MTARKDATGKTGPRRRLGRGLGSLISAPPVPIEATPDGELEAVAALETAPAPGSAAGGSGSHAAGVQGGGLTTVAVSLISPSPYQPRQTFDDEAIEALGASIRAAGLMQPVVVRPHGTGFQLIVGERRWRAAQRIGLESIPALVRELDDQTATEWALVENIQREDLNPIERAEAFRRLIDDFGLTHQDLADRVGLSRSSVTNQLRLIELDDMTKDAVRQGRLTLGHAKALLSITNLETRRRLAEMAVRQAWSVRALERRAAARMAAPSAPAGGRGGTRPATAQTAALEREISQQLGTRVALRPGRTKGSGRLVIEFYSLDQFDGLLQRMGVTVTS
jgi:ParB family chromosome partitioning protein